MNEELLEQILSCPALPSLPAVAVRVVELTQRPDASLDDLAATIQNDQALAAKVLKTVNSSFYGLRMRCSTINQALVMLGMSTVKSLALGFSLVSSVPNDTGDEFDLTAYWRRGLYTAVAARCIADAAGKVYADEAFLGGLLQDIGMMAMHQALGERYDKLAAAAGPHRRLAKAELAELDVQHADIGAMLTERWKFPPELVLPVKYHERPTAAPAEHADIVRCVGLGNMAHDVLTDADPGPALRRFQIHAQLWFGMGPDESEALLTRIAAGAR
jgi:HD-like signal output (HDOD) protein